VTRRRKKKRLANPTAAPTSFEQFFDKVTSSAKRATVQVLDAVEKDPERAFQGVGHILSEGEKLVDRVRTTPKESRRALRNELFSLAAKGIKKAIEGG
jgi:hypothetical protein